MGQLQSEAKDARLEAELETREAGRLTLRYKFYNKSDSRSAYLFNLLYEEVDETTGYMVDKNFFYVEFEDDKVLMSKKLVPVPPLVFVEKLNIPCVTRVRPGESFEESLTIVSPLSLRNPYLQAGQGKRYVIFEKHKLFFELGYFFAYPGSGDKLANTVKTAIGPSLRFDPFPPSSQSILGLGPFDISIQVKIPSSQGTVTGASP